VQKCRPHSQIAASKTVFRLARIDGLATYAKFCRRSAASS
jgi:hypothetical protein